MPPLNDPLAGFGYRAVGPDMDPVMQGLFPNSGQISGAMMGAAQGYAPSIEFLRKYGIQPGAEGGESAQQEHAAGAFGTPGGPPIAPQAQLPATMGRPAPSLMPRAPAPYSEASAQDLPLPPSKPIPMPPLDKPEAMLPALSYAPGATEPGRPFVPQGMPSITTAGTDAYPVTATPAPSPSAKGRPWEAYRAQAASMLPAISWIESRHNPSAVGAAGELTQFQIMPSTARQPGFGVQPLKDFNDPKEVERFATDFLASMLWRANGDPHAAIVGWNAGAGRIPKYQQAGGDLKSIPKVTQRYLAQFDALMPDWRRIAQGVTSQTAG